MSDATLYEHIFKHMQSGLMILNQKLEIVDVNPAFSVITGYDHAEVVGQVPSFLHSGYHDQSFIDAMWDQLQTTGAWQGEIWSRQETGEIYPGTLTISRIDAANGQVGCYAGIFSVSHTVKSSDDTYLQLAFYDPLTKLLNRKMLIERLSYLMKTHERAMANPKQQPQAEMLMAVIFINLNAFKRVNKQYGMRCGDQVILAIAERLKALVRATDIVARYRADEFVLALPYLHHHDEAILLCERVNRLFDSTIKAGSAKVRVNAAMGVSLYPQDADEPELLVDLAQVAMQSAKEVEHVQAYRFYDEIC